MLNTKEHNEKVDKIRFIDLVTQKKQIKTQVMSSLEEVIESGQFIQGNFVNELESGLSEYIKSKHTIACSSGTDALLLAMLALPLETGDAVLIPSFGFVAAAEMALLCGLQPVFIDSDLETFNIRLEDVITGHKEATEKGLNVKAIVAINTYGMPCDYSSLKEFCKIKELYLIEDCAQSFGAKYQDSYSGNLGDIGCTSFFPSKPLGCYGDGGAVFTNNQEFEQIIRSKLKHGQSNKKYDYITTGINGRLDTMQAAVLIQKMKIFDKELSNRQKVASYYSEKLKDVLYTPNVPEDRTSAWAQYTLRHPKRDQIIQHLNDLSIPTAIHYPKPLHSQEPYKKCMIVSNGCPNAQELSQTVFSIPMHPYLTPEQQDKIVNAIKEVI